MRIISLAIFALALTACATSEPPARTVTLSCEDAPKIGLFDPSRDLLMANYDSKPDVDDLQAVAGLERRLASAQIIFGFDDQQGVGDFVDRFGR